MEAHNLERRLFTCKAGHALLWASNMVHGGSEIRDANRTRWSQAVHYYFEDTDKYFCPMFSNTPEGEYALKDLSTKDIRGLYAK